MKRFLATVVPVALVLGLAGTANAVPLETPDDTYGVNGRVRSVVVVGDNVWLGGRFTAVTNGNSTSSIRSSTGLAVFSRTTGQLATAAVPRLTGSGVEVWKLDTDGARVYAAGKFNYDGTTKKNLISFDGTTGLDVTTYAGPPSLKSVEVANGVVYAGGAKLLAYDAASGSKISSFATTSAKTYAELRAHTTTPAFRSLEIGPDGWLYGACQCDQLLTGGAAPFVKALVRFHATTGAWDASWTPYQTDISTLEPGAAFGIDIELTNGIAYLAAGGSDFASAVSTTVDDDELWKTDTSGSSQAVALLGTELLVGGHFDWVADRGLTPGQCGSNQTPVTACVNAPKLVAMDTANKGSLIKRTDGSVWNPTPCCKYNGVWTLVLDGSFVHVGGEFTKINGTAQTYYGRLPLS